MEYIICIIIMLIWAMIFYCWGYVSAHANIRKNMCKLFSEWLEFAEKNEPPVKGE